MKVRASSSTTAVPEALTGVRVRELSTGSIWTLRRAPTSVMSGFEPRFSRRSKRKAGKQASQFLATKIENKRFAPCELCPGFFVSIKVNKRRERTNLNSVDIHTTKHTISRHACVHARARMHNLQTGTNTGKVGNARNLPRSGGGLEGKPLVSGAASSGSRLLIPVGYMDGKLSFLSNDRRRD